MKKFRRTIAKFLVSALLLPLLASVGPASLTALAAEFLSGAVPSQVYLNVYLQQRVSGNEYIGWKIEADDHYTISATKLGDTYYADGAAAFNNSFADADGSAYTGYFTSTDLAKWTLVTEAVDSSVWNDGEWMNVSVPLNYVIVTAAGKTVKRGGDSSLISVADLFTEVPSLPQADIVSVDHIVAAGDSLASIAKKYDVEVENIKYANSGYFYNLSESNKAAGTDIEIEKDITLSIPTTKLNAVNYTVRPGDTLWGIAFNYYGTMSASKVMEIKNANKELFQKSKGVLEAGASLNLPANGIKNPVTISNLYDAVGIYRVKLGDTVSGLNKKYYGAQADYLGKIYDANKDKIKKIGKVHMIYDQQWLVITK